jgi:hypothetical protein
VAVAASSRATVAPGSSSAPTITGTTTAGSTLTANPGTWSGSATITFQYQWMSCNSSGASCAPIAGATSQTYLLQTSNVGATLIVQVIATNSDGSATAQSGATATIAAATALATTTLPTISGTAAVGSTLTANTGTWTGTAPITYAYQWLGCDASGASCNPISSAASATYTAQTSDLGTTLRVQVTATNPSGSATAESAQSAAIAAASTAVGGCPSGAKGQSVAVSTLAAPVRLQVAKTAASGVLGSQTQSFTATFHVTDTCGQVVSGADVYVTAVPYNQFSIPAQQATGSAGNVTFTFQRKAGYPVAKHQQLLVLFVRASRPGDPVLAGVSTERLVSVAVSLGG